MTGKRLESADSLKVGQVWLVKDAGQVYNIGEMAYSMELEGL